MSGGNAHDAVGGKTFTTKVVFRVPAGGQQAQILLPLSTGALGAIRTAFVHHKRISAKVGAVATADNRRVQKQPSVSVRR